MIKYKRIPATYEIWILLQEKYYNQLKAQNTFLFPSANYPGDLEEKMITEYGFVGAACPLCGIEMSWQTDPKSSIGKRVDENRKYWLCVPVEERNDEQ